LKPPLEICPGAMAEFDSFISPARIFSPGAAPMLEFNHPRPVAGDLEPGGKKKKKDALSLSILSYDAFLYL
jgi:hypothetical protein